MSNVPYYQQEQALKQHIRTMPEKELRDLMVQFVHEMPVSVVQDLMGALKCPEQTPLETI